MSLYDTWASSQQLNGPDLVAQPQPGMAMVGQHAGMLKGLAGQWEEDKCIRRQARESGRLVHWPSPETVGQASMTHVCRNPIMPRFRLQYWHSLGSLRKALLLNVPVLNELALRWVNVYNFPAKRVLKTPPLQAIMKEASWLVTISRCSELSSISCLLLSATSGRDLLGGGRWPIDAYQDLDAC